MTQLVEKKENIKAYIFDLDGVLTQTHNLHARAWNKLFLEFLGKRRQGPHTENEDLHDYDDKNDYQRFLDGKPRLEGIKSFFRSRNIPYEENLIRELGEKKNIFYQKLLEMEGPHTVPESVSFIQKLREHNVPMAVVSSSRNCRLILKMAGIDDYFKVIIDPQIAESKHLQGKPRPDYFIEAAQKLNKRQNECAIVEDSLAGVKAGKDGDFKKVYAIKLDKDKQAMEKLKAEGADQVLSSLWEIKEAQEMLTLPDVFTVFKDIFPESEKKNYFLFLDFDGTLSPIVAEPEKARPLEGIKEIVQRCSEFFPVCIITGRDTEVIKKLLPLTDIYYAACHGFEITGPKEYHYELPEALALIPVFDKAQHLLTLRLSAMEGLIIERKKFGLAFHYRKIGSDSVIAELKKEIQEYCLNHQELRFQLGEKVIEIQPHLNWDKGKALLKLYQVLNLKMKDTPPLYLGDGNTDEDAFREMRDCGVPILASIEARPTLARYHLKGPQKVKKFLETIYEHKKKEN